MSCLSSRQFGPETVDDQFREPRIPVFLRQLLPGQEGPQLRSHLELGDEKADHVVRPNPLDERMVALYACLAFARHSAWSSSRRPTRPASVRSCSFFSVSATATARGPSAWSNP